MESVIVNQLPALSVQPLQDTVFLSLELFPCLDSHVLIQKLFLEVVKFLKSRVLILLERDGLSTQFSVALFHAFIFE